MGAVCFIQQVVCVVQSPVKQKTATAQTTVQERCSFHLAVPMIEAYFFGEEPEALARAGAVIGSTVSGDNMDVEHFQVTGHIHEDTDYVGAPAGQRNRDPFWTISPDYRPFHRHQTLGVWAKASDSQTPYFAVFLIFYPL